MYGKERSLRVLTLLYGLVALAFGAWTLATPDRTAQKTAAAHRRLAARFPSFYKTAPARSALSGSRRGSIVIGLGMIAVGIGFIVKAPSCDRF